MKPIVYTSAFLSLLLLGGCNSSSDNYYIPVENSGLDKQLSTLIEEHNLTGDPSTGRDNPSITDPEAQLGMKLFFTKTLGVAGDTACVTCHHPLLGGGDGVQISIGTGATDTDVFGYDRVLDPLNSAIFDDVGGGPTQTVNAPTSYNAGLHDRFMAWHGIIEAADPSAGYNGTVGGIYNPDSAYEEDNSTRIVDPFAGDNIPASQARFPVQNPIEMAGHNPLIKDLSSFEIRKILLDRFTGEGNSGALGTDYLTAEQRAAWKKAFDDAGVELNDANIYNMIAYYERTQLFIENPWKQYVEGNLTALSDDAKKGAILFFSDYTEGGANCAYCHKGDFFTDNALHVMAVPQIGLGTQKDDNNESTGDSFGREDITHQRSDRYKWRTMQLLNVEKTGPWSHDGAFTTLRAMVQHMVDPSTPYDESNILQPNMQNIQNIQENHDKALAQLEKNRLDGISPHRVADLDDTQIDQLVEFLKSLTDPRLNDYEYMKQWVPEISEESEILDLQVGDSVTFPPEATLPQ